MIGAEKRQCRLNEIGNATISTPTSFTGYYDWLHNTLFQAELQSPRISGVLYRFIIHLCGNCDKWADSVSLS